MLAAFQRTKAQRTFQHIELNTQALLAYDDRGRPIQHIIIIVTVIGAVDAVRFTANVTFSH